MACCWVGSGPIHAPSRLLYGQSSKRTTAILLLWLLAQVRVQIQALTLVSVDVPSPTIVGESVELTCLYDLHDEQLYSVKWYKDDIEFYRYVPNDRPSPAQYLPVPGIRIDLNKSNAFTALLKSVDLNSAGTYRCEVSAEAPSFATEEAEKVLQVLVLPSQGPTILGGRSKYRVGDTVNVNCTSAKSKPAAVLKWYINDQPAKLEYEFDYSTTLHADGLESSSLGLRFSTTWTHFEKGNMKLKCMATVSQIYTMSNEEVVFGGLQQTSGQLHVSENEGLVLNSASSWSKPRDWWTGLSWTHLICLTVSLSAELRRSGHSTPYELISRW